MHIAWVWSDGVIARSASEVAPNKYFYLGSPRIGSDYLGSPRMASDGLGKSATCTAESEVATSVEPDLTHKPPQLICATLGFQIYFIFLNRYPALLTDIHRDAIADWRFRIAD